LEIVAGGKDIEMTLVYSSVQGVNYAAAAFALVAAVLWFASASVKTPSSFDINFEISVSSYDGSAGGTGYSLGLSNLAEALKSQSRWSGYAAVCAGVAAILTALALIIAKFMLRAPGGLSCRQVLHWSNLRHS
jgi:hypothetical protein